ncbi:hypothetical protein AK812_SmicGene27368 [Symbiodinium microadriaticum]|uniref:Uncharacterized protein n=1 Tax=Symbiodinium microadriaticum TaxID=2951 RepID=A0A1Q9D777_SYMMI|nr:hypothetical protein AK812_SmicGene27368 [Symbiodinium microadriaticum]
MSQKRTSCGADCGCVYKTDLRWHLKGSARKGALNSNMNGRSLLLTACQAREPRWHLKGSARSKQLATAKSARNKGDPVIPGANMQNKHTLATPVDTSAFKDDVKPKSPSAQCKRLQVEGLEDLKILTFTGFAWKEVPRVTNTKLAANAKLGTFPARVEKSYRFPFAGPVASSWLLAAMVQGSTSARNELTSGTAGIEGPWLCELESRAGSPYLLAVRGTVACWVTVPVAVRGTVACWVTVPMAVRGTVACWVTLPVAERGNWKRSDFDRCPASAPLRLVRVPSESAAFTYLVVDTVLTSQTSFMGLDGNVKGAVQACSVAEEFAARYRCAERLKHQEELIARLARRDECG